MQGLVAERDKAFRAQAFALKQANTRAAQLQQQQAELVSQEAALLEELSHRATQAETSTADSMQANDQGVSMKKTRRLPSGTDSMRRRLETTMSTGNPPFSRLLHTQLLPGSQAIVEAAQPLGQHGLNDTEPASKTTQPSGIEVWLQADSLP